MTKLKEISISGFKAIDELEMDLGDINIITGRNNTGKTSFLEAVNLLFNPTQINEFSGNVGDIINKNNDKCEINCTYERSDQMTLEAFTQEDPFIRDRELNLIVPEDSVAIGNFIQAIIEIVETGPDSTYYIDRFWGEKFEHDEQDDINEIFTQALRQSINELSEDYLRPKISGNCIILEIDGQEFPFVYLGKYYDEISEEVVDSAAKTAYEEFIEDRDKVDNSEDDIEISTLTRVFSDLMVPRLGKGRFIGPRPERVGGLRFIENIMISQGEVDPTERNSAIIVSEIEEYLRENIIDNLKDFSFDSIVFEDNGDPYQIPYNFMGDGFKSFVSILWVLYQHNVTNNVLMLEEPENNMHPGYINELVYRLVEIAMGENLQLFITTHNPDFINAFLSDNIERKFGSYLTEEFNIIQMADRTSQIIPYQRADDQLKNLNLDLRGL